MNPYATILREIISLTFDSLLDLPIAELQHKASPQSWSKLEIVGHLIDSAYNNYQRFLRASGQSDLSFPGYAQDEWVKRAGYQNR
ncbi:MAG: DinB family protein, partial [Bacteroidota bacterium]